MLTHRFTPARGIRTALLLCLCALAALLFTAPQARATSDDPVTAQASYLAERLRENPVHVTDQLPRVVPRSTAPDFARLAQRTGVPTYVVVLPYQESSASEALLTAVHDRLGRDGLYVLIDETGVAAASDHGMNVPAEHAATAVQGELPYDAGPLLSFERFTDVVTLTPEEAEGRAEAASGPAPEGMYIGSADRDDQSFATGALLTGVPLSILLPAPLVHRWRRRRPTATPTSLKRRRGLRHPLFLGTVAAVLAAGAIAGTASLVFDETKSSAAPPPAAADLSSRIERVVTGLRDDPVYLDPESRRFLDARRLDRLHERVRAFGAMDGGGPVFVTVVPQPSDSETRGRPDLFAAAVHGKLGKDGVYVVADPGTGTIDVVNFGLRLDSDHLTTDLPEPLAWGDSRARDADDHLLGERLDALMTHLEKTPRTKSAEFPHIMDATPDPADDTNLPPLFSGEFLPGLALGAVGAVLLFLVAAGGLGVVLAVSDRRNPTPTPLALLPVLEPTHPTRRHLRRVAYTELKALERVWATTARRATLARECRQAALLLANGSPDVLRTASLPADTLVAVVVLARAARVLLTGEAEADLCCAVNPLHGPTAARHHVRVSPGEPPRRRWLPVCTPCKDTAVAEPATLPDTFMTLPAPRRSRTRYDETAGLLTSVPDGVAALAAAARARR